MQREVCKLTTQHKQQNMRKDCSLAKDFNVDQFCLNYVIYTQIESTVPGSDVLANNYIISSSLLHRKTPLC